MYGLNPDKSYAAVNKLIVDIKKLIHRKDWQSEHMCIISIVIDNILWLIRNLSCSIDYKLFPYYL